MPPSYTGGEAVPLVFLFHGLGQGHQNVYDYTALNERFAAQEQAHASNAAQLEDGLAAEAAERKRTEEAFRALEAHVAEQRDYVAKLEAELAARATAAPPSRWPLRRNP